MSAEEIQLWRELEDEISLWRSGGMTPRLFLRDDDAVENTPALKRLVAVCERYEAPLLLAIIPEPAKEELVDVLESASLVTPAVHGYRHEDHSAPGEKACELGAQRPLETVLSELKLGRSKMLQMFGERLSALLVPPWNRIHDAVRDHVSEAGFRAVSAHGWLKTPSPTRMVNTHIDIIHWSGGRIGRPLSWVQIEILRNLRLARQKGGRAIGLLTHHLTHDEVAWRALDQVLAWSTRNQIDFVDGDSLIGEPSEPIEDQP